jgi:hypothetical protein
MRTSNQIGFDRNFRASKGDPPILALFRNSLATAQEFLGVKTAHRSGKNLASRLVSAKKPLMMSGFAQKRPPHPPA